MSYRFKADKCLAVISAWPDMQVEPQLIAWLNHIGVAQIYVHRSGDGRMDCGYNYAIQIALGSKFNQFIFADKDIKPYNDSLEFLKGSEDCVGVAYDTGHDRAFEHDECIHTGLWRTRRRVLEAVGIRPFMWKYNETGTGVIDCLCNPFFRRVRSRGFSTKHRGYAIHIPRNQQGPVWTSLQLVGK